MLSTVGLDIVSGRPRLIFMDITGFYHGINFLVLAIGIYGIGEMLWTVEQSKGDMMLSKATVSVRRTLDALMSVVRTTKTMLMGSFLGYFVGILPAAGATPGSLMAYGVAKTMSKDPASFGKGNLEGVVAPESANNSASTGSMLPMLTLGIPGSPTTAILLGGMVMWGLEPGPLLFVEHKEFVWPLIASLYVANLFALIINIAFIPAFIAVLKMPFSILAPIIYVLCVVGGYAPTKDMHDVWLMLILRRLRISDAQTRLSAGAGGLGYRAGATGRAGDAPVPNHVPRLGGDLLRPPDRRYHYGHRHRALPVAVVQRRALEAALRHLWRRGLRNSRPPSFF